MGSWPDPVPFELEDGNLSASVAALISGPGAALAGLLLVGDRSGFRGGGAPSTAVRLARAWARSGRRVILVDLGFDDPTLHELVGAANDQGITDHFAFGTSLDQLAVRADDGAWSLVPAGPWGGDPLSVNSFTGWPRLLRECAARDATLLAYAPADLAGLPILARTFGAVMVVGAVRELPGVSPFSVVAVIETGREPAPPAPAAAAPTPRREPRDQAFERIRLPTDARTREQLIAELRDRQRAAIMAPPEPGFRPSLADLAGTEAPPGATEAAGVLSPEAAALPSLAPLPLAAGEAKGARPAAAFMGEPPTPVRILTPPRRRSRAPLWWTLAVLALLSLLAGSWHFMQVRLRSKLASEEAAGAVEAPPTLPQPTPRPPAADTVLAYVVALEEHVRLPNAAARVAALRTGVPGVNHFVVPVVRDDALYYQVVSGPVADSGAAAALRDSLEVRGQVPVGTDAQVQRAPLAFLLGEYPAPDLAELRVNGLRRLEIPTYVVPVAGPPARYRVYAGGYAVPTDGAVMREILQSVGEADQLVERVGRR